MAYTIKRVETAQDWEDFIDCPWLIYAGNAFWVPPLKLSVKELLDVNKNPFFKHASMAAFIVHDDRGECVGRVAGIIDENHNKFQKENTAFFGFFESTNDQNLANLLLDTASQWAKSKGMTMMRGPMNPSTNHECGMLIEGFEDTPTVMTTYNLSYYQNLIETWGMTKSKDLFAYHVDSAIGKFSDKIMAQAEKAKQSGNIKFRAARLENFDQEVKLIMDIYNDAWEQNWGFVPMEPEEMMHLAKELKTIVDPELLLIAEVAGEPAAFGLALPDVNLALHKVQDGKLFPTGIFKLLWNLKGPGKKNINRCRMITLGVKKKYREYGLGPLIYVEYLKRAPALGYPVGEASWILEDNIPMNKAIAGMGGKKTKTYRVYEKSL